MSEGTTTAPGRADDEGSFMREVLQRIATGPTMSKDLSRDEARRAMRSLLAGTADEVQAGVFLIALRMKRETDAELAGVLDAIHDGVRPVPLALDALLTLVDPYDGFLRGAPVAPFLPAVLAACGTPTLAHGVRSMGPKFGASHARVLDAAGVPVADSLEAARAALESPDVGWCHALQSAIAPELAALETLRTRIVKRPCLTTVEVGIRAFRPHGSSHLLTGFVHKGYPRIYATIARAAGFDGVTIVRGVEGGVVPSLAQGSRMYTARLASAEGERGGGRSGTTEGAREDGEKDRVDEEGEGLVETALDPRTLGIRRDVRAVPLPATLAERAEGSVRSVRAPDDPFARALAVHAADVGLAALGGEPGEARDALVYGGAVALLGAGATATLEDGAERVRAALDDGSARARLFAPLG